MGRIRLQTGTRIFLFNKILRRSAAGITPWHALQTQLEINLCAKTRDTFSHAKSNVSRVMVVCMRVN